MPLGVLELSNIFSTCNFPTSEAGLGEKPISDSNEEELDIGMFFLVQFFSHHCKINRCLLIYFLLLYVIDDLDIEDHDDSFKHEPNGAPKTSSMVKKIRRKLKGGTVILDLTSNL